MSRKQEIYRHMLSASLAFCRNRQTASFFTKLRSKDVYFEADLVHSLPNIILEPEFTDDDVQFLNRQAKYYIEKCNASISVSYSANKEYIIELISLLPEELRKKIEPYV